MPWILHTECNLCLPYGSHNKQRLFPQTALTDWALLRRNNVFLLDIQGILLIECLCVPCGSHNKQRLFPQTVLTGWDL
jgi:hypothetical protein